MKILFYILIIMTISSCVTKDKYPSDWIPLPIASKTECKNISGEYNNIGENTLEHGEHNLSYILAPNIPLTSETENVHVEVIDARLLRLELINKFGDVTRTEIDASAGFMCKDGVYTIERSELLNSGGAIGKQWYSLRLYSNIDSLVIEKKQGALGALFFIPIAGTETHWLRFKRP